MTRDVDRLDEFVASARESGAADDTIARLLKTAGWSQQEIDRALTRVYERTTGTSVPKPRSRSVSARDAFLYLLAFLTLGIWTQSLGQLGFIFINIAVADPLTDRSYADPGYGLAFGIARLLVAYPVYLSVMGQLTRELKANAERYRSSVRRWLLYLTVFIVTAIAIATLTFFLTSFLRGELTLRFVLKVLVILVIDGGVLSYYALWLRRDPT